MFIFTLYDKVAEKCGHIFTTETVGEAERQFLDAIATAEKGSVLYTHPQDYSLQLLGEFDPKQIKIVNTDTRLILSGKEKTSTTVPA